MTWKNKKIVTDNRIENIMTAGFSFRHCNRINSVFNKYEFILSK